MQCRREGKDEVSQCANAHRHRQGPVFRKLYQIHGAKIVLLKHKIKGCGK